VTCPHPFLSLGSGCYYIPPETNIDWIHASAICSLDYKGYLSEITDPQEQANIAGLIHRTDPKSTYYYYIGATDSQQEGNFRWMTSGNYVAYSNWNPGEPNNHAGSQNCAFLHPYSNLCKWDDVGCEARTVFSSPLKAVCEANPVEPLNTSPKTTCCCTNEFIVSRSEICTKPCDPQTSSGNSIQFPEDLNTEKMHSV